MKWDDMEIQKADTQNLYSMAEKFGADLSVLPIYVRFRILLPNRADKF